jgi:ATP-dependent protease HslVU (ClpYQ) peptidase subunit
VTTIAYRDGFMAADSKCTAGDAHITRINKVYRLTSGGLLGVCGDADVRDMVALLDKVRSAKSLPSRKALAETKTDFGGILVLRNGDIFDIEVGHYEDAKEWNAGAIEIKDGFYAVGSGARFALGAMAVGASAYNAVLAACKFDTASGGPVRAVALKETTKLKRAA